MRGSIQVRLTRIRFQQRRIRVRDRAPRFPGPAAPHGRSMGTPRAPCRRPRVGWKRVGVPLDRRDAAGLGAGLCRATRLWADCRSAAWPQHLASRRRRRRAPAAPRPRTAPARANPPGTRRDAAFLGIRRPRPSGFSSRWRFSAPPWPAPARPPAATGSRCRQASRRRISENPPAASSGICLAIGGRSVRGGRACGPVPP